MLLNHCKQIMLFSALKIEKCPFTYWLNGRWFLQIVDRDSGNLYPIYPLFPCSDFFISNVRGGGNVFLAFYAISNISREKMFFWFLWGGGGWCWLLNLLAGDLGWPSCLVLWLYRWSLLENVKYLLHLYFNGLYNQNFTFKKKVNFECQMASVGTWSHNGDFSSECKKITFSVKYSHWDNCLFLVLDIVS